MDSAALGVLTQTFKGTQISSALEIFLFLTFLSIGPLLLITVTSFTRVVIVLSFLRQALGTQQSPSNQIVIALSLFISFHVMAPVWKAIDTEALTPYYRREIGAVEALERAWAPLERFLLKHTRKADVALFAANVNGEQVAADAVRPTMLIPAFMISELKTAFQMAFMIYVPFLILDLVVASILMSMGMMFLPPVLISLPFKLMLFVLVDGWHILIGSLLRSFA
jgi:flagellar biosynthetic protein FliP